MSLVTVIIPTYNRALLIGRAIESVFDQTFQDFELIVVDDGSADATREVLDRYGSRVEAIFTENRGVAAARNAGLARARGELVAFLDSDDEWLPRKLELQVSLYRDRSKPFVCHTNEIWMRDGKEVRQKAVHRKQGGRFFERALERCLISPSSVILSRGTLDRVGWFDESFEAAEDYDLWLRITAFHEVHYIAEPLVIKHGGHGDQLSFTVPAIDRFRARAVEKMLLDSRLSPENRRAAVEELVRKCLIVAAGCEKRNKIDEARKYRELAKRHQAD